MQVTIETPISRKQHICTVTVIIDELALHYIEVRYGRKGLYLSFPSRMYHPITESFRQKVFNAIIDKLKQYPEFIRLHSDKI